jgi:hypothetical protein
MPLHARTTLALRALVGLSLAVPPVLFAMLLAGKAIGARVGPGRRGKGAPTSICIRANALIARL